MKKLKKFAALLLVGVMALALLTACGGGGGPTEEQKVLAQISQEKGVQATNDAKLRAVAEGHLNEDRKDLDANFKIAGYLTAFNFHSEKVGNDRVITITARYDYKDTLLNAVLKKISEHVDTNKWCHGEPERRLVEYRRCGQGQQRAELHWYFHPHQGQKVKNSSPFLPGAWPQGRPSGLFCV